MNSLSVTSPKRTRRRFSPEFKADIIANASSRASPWPALSRIMRAGTGVHQAVVPGRAGSQRPGNAAASDHEACTSHAHCRGAAYMDASSSGKSTGRDRDSRYSGLQPEPLDSTATLSGWRRCADRPFTRSQNTPERGSTSWALSLPGVEPILVRTPDSG